MEKEFDPNKINAEFVISSFKNKERRNNPSAEPRALLPPEEMEEIRKADEANQTNESGKVGSADNENTTVEPDIANNADASGRDNIGTITDGAIETIETIDITKRTTSRRRKAAFEEYQKLFLTTPKIKHRKPVFISEEIRERLDEIARKLGDKGMSASGIIENMVIQHLKTYGEDIEFWRRL